MAKNGLFQKKENKMDDRPMTVKERIVADYIELKRVFAFVGLSFFIQEGGVLGYGRHKDIMDHDFDIDIGSTEEPSDAQKVSLYYALMAKGWTNIVPREDFDFARRLVSLNIWWWHKEGDFYVGKPSSTPGKIFIMKAKWFDKPFPRADYPFGSFLIPNNYEDYLDHRYGKDWGDNVFNNDKDWKAEEQKRKASGDWDMWPKHSWEEV